MLETDYQNKILKPAIHERFPGCFVFKQDESQCQGIPDLIVLYGNQYAIIECKRSAKAKYRPNQEFYLDMFTKWNVLAMTSYPENFEWTLEMLEGYFNADKQ